MFYQYINGRCVPGEGAPLAVLNPATNDVIDTIGGASTAQAEEALKAARAAFPMWAALPVAKRVEWMQKLSDAVTAHKDTIFDLLMQESGKPYTAACYDYGLFTTRMKFYEEEALRVYGSSLQDYDHSRGEVYHLLAKRPLGVVVGHVAWNFPLGNAMCKIGPAMASGCTLVLKPSSKTPLSMLFIGRLCEEIGLPAGVFNIVAGNSSEVGNALNSSPIPKLITLIGSSRTGLEVMQKGASSSVKKYSLELGGNAPVIVTPDYDTKAAARFTVAKKIGNSGQVCINYNRIYVHESVYDEYIAEVLEGLKQVKLGWGHDEGNIMGPMIDTRSRDRMVSLIQDAVKDGATLVYGGEVPTEGRFARGNFITPALLTDVTEDMRVAKEEIFGPIIAVQKYSDFEEVLARANNTEMGLTGYLFSHDARAIARAFEVMETGELYVNNAQNACNLPHVGIKQSGVGADCGALSLDEYFDTRRLSMIP